jgi:hypothetical protein
MIKNLEVLNMSKWKSMEFVNGKLVEKAETAYQSVDDTKAKNLIAGTRTLKAEDLRKEADELFESKKVQEDALLDSYNEKKLKSKHLISKAEHLIKLREKKNK